MTYKSYKESRYHCTDIKFGNINQDAEGTQISAYFASLFVEEQYNMEFSISFQGIGLPADLYNEFTSLLLLYNNSYHCDGMQQNYCHIPAPVNATNKCEGTLAYFRDFFLQVYVDYSNTYLRIPITSLIETFDNECYILVGQSMYNGTENDHSKIILGGKVFQQLQGIFTNTYTQVNTVEVTATQKAVLYLN